MTNWLVSETFGLEQARSKEAEEAIEAAEAFMRGEDNLPRGLSTRAAIHARLQKLLPAGDVFWPRWIVKTQLNTQPAARKRAQSTEAPKATRSKTKKTPKAKP